MKLTSTQAIQLADAQANGKTITALAIAQVLGNASVTFASVEYVTKVATAAAHSNEVIQKVTIASVILASSLKAHTSVYANKVKRTAEINTLADALAVEKFVPADNYFEHTAVHCIVTHKKDVTKQYLYALFNNNGSSNNTSLYIHNGVVVDEQHVAQYLTPSAAKQMLSKDTTVVNKTHNIKHSAIVRTISLSSIVSIKARKRLLTVV